MGALVHGAGTATIVVRGVESLHGATHQPIPDRIEAGTLCCAAAAAGGNILLRNARPEQMRALLLAGLTADGITRVEDGAGHIDRGYVRLEETLSALGAKVRRL